VAERVIIGLGGNLSDPSAGLPLAWRCAVHALALDRPQLSSVHSSRPAEGASGAHFANAVGVGYTTLGPVEVLRILQGIEHAFGRARWKEQATRGRPLDLDLVDHGARIMNEPGLELPHPRLASRDFVLMPVVEIAVDFVDPKSGRKATELLAHLPQELRTITARGGHS